MRYINRRFLLVKKLISIKKQEFSEKYQNDVIQKIMKPFMDERDLRVKIYGNNYFDGLKNYRSNYSRKYNIKIVRSSSNVEHKINVEIPLFIDDFAIRMKGVEKYPLFQVIDRPVIMKEDKIILATNITTFSYNKEDRTIAFKMGNKVVSILFDILYHAICEKIINDDWISLADKELNKYGTTLSSVKNFIKSIEKVDFFTMQWLKTDSILKEIKENINSPKINKLVDFDNKRIRCLEVYLHYFIQYMAERYFQYLEGEKNKKSDKRLNWGKLRTDQLFELRENHKNLSNAISTALKITHDGPMGLESQFFRAARRDIDGTQYNKVCPINTPDRDKTGVILHLSVNCAIDEIYKNITETKIEFLNEKRDGVKIPVSFNIASIPFFNHDDGSRLQMGASYMNHSVMVSDPDAPLVVTGFDIVGDKL